MNVTLRVLTTVAVASCAALVSQVEAATLTGLVATPEGQSVAGALVTLWNEPRNRKETVYTNAEGKYVLETGFSGKVQLRGRAPMYRDFNVEFEVAVDDSQQHNLALVKLTDPQEISDSLTASAHAAALPFPDQKTRDTFISQCSYCHQQGNSLTRRPRPDEEWTDVMWRMEGYGAYITYGEHRRIMQLLGDGFNGKPVNVVQTAPYSPEMTRARIEEWHAGDPLSFLHDTIVGHDGKLYGIDEGKDVIFILDRRTSEIEVVKIPVEADDQVGGRFRGVRLPIGVFTGMHGPHSAALTRDGTMYITGALSGKLIRFNPETREWKFFTIPPGFLWRKGLYPHTIRTDHDDNVWFTVTMSNRVMMFDTKAEKFTDIGLPHDGFLRWMSDTLMGVVMKIIQWFPEQNLHLVLSHHKWLNGGHSTLNMPYGIDINPLDNSVWYGKLLGNKIGVVNRRTLEVVEYSTPYTGPRRMRFGPDGILWIPSFDEGKLMRFDPKTTKFESIDLPVLSKGEYEMPYALAVHQGTGDVWIAANNTDRVLRYLPQEKRFIAYPMPNRVIWFRDIDFTRDGKVCMSNSNLPAYAHEDTVPAFICIEPEPNGTYGAAL
ncbi:MAG: carboxypeptidase regulatory-like domain-containing protein [Proteobacteria bacterium]|nr:carboxypeptidase regulatory-like domain-containing protein [Pseudomonadota bacterium]